MRRLFRAGLIAASAQVMAVVAATAAVTIAFRYGLVIPASGRLNRSRNPRPVSCCGAISSWLSALRSRETGSLTRPLCEFVKQPDAFIRPRPIMRAKLFSFSCGSLLPFLPFLLFVRHPGC